MVGKTYINGFASSYLDALLVNILVFTYTCLIVDFFGIMDSISILFSTSYTNKIVYYLSCGKGQPTVVKSLPCLQRDHKCSV